jgi:hypothetical protein
MLVLGLVLILIAAGVLVAMLVSGSTGPEATMFDGHLHASALIFFLIGAGTLLVFIMGLELVRSGLRRANRNRKNNKRLRRLERREAAHRGEAPQRDAATTADPAAATTDAERAPADASTSADPASTDQEVRRTDGPYQTPPPAR